AVDKVEKANLDVKKRPKTDKYVQFGGASVAAGGPGAIGKEEAQVLDHGASMHPPPGPGASRAGW
ncbi:hypothetical protein ACFC63_19770, partial [Streptomyces albidoflavus]